MCVLKPRGFVAALHFSRIFCFCFEKLAAFFTVHKRLTLLSCFIKHRVFWVFCYTWCWITNNLQDWNIRNNPRVNKIIVKYVVWGLKNKLRQVKDVNYKLKKENNSCSSESTLLTLIIKKKNRNSFFYIKGQNWSKLLLRTDFIWLIFFAKIAPLLLRSSINDVTLYDGFAKDFFFENYTKAF